jgi:hypothetical protein
MYKYVFAIKTKKERKNMENESNVTYEAKLSAVAN